MSPLDAEIQRFQVAMYVDPVEPLDGKYRLVVQIEKAVDVVALEGSMELFSEVDVQFLRVMEQRSMLSVSGSTFEAFRLADLRRRSPRSFLSPNFRRS